MYLVVRWSSVHVVKVVYVPGKSQVFFQHRLNLQVFQKPEAVLHEKTCKFQAEFLGFNAYYCLGVAFDKFFSLIST
jgi:hypothetical protein